MIFLTLNQKLNIYKLITLLYMRVIKKRSIFMNNEVGYIYILTNPSFPQYVKIPLSWTIKGVIMKETVFGAVRISRPSQNIDRQIRNITNSSL